MIKASFTMEFENSDEVAVFENLIQQFFAKPINIIILPDTTNLYKTDDTFKELVKAEKKAKKLKKDYILNSRKKEYINLQKQK